MDSPRITIHQKTLVSLKARFEQNPLLFEKVFELLANAVLNRGTFILALCRPRPGATATGDGVARSPNASSFWRVPRRTTDPEHAADLFRTDPSWFPREGASVALAEAGWAMLDGRHDVAKALGDWKSCKIEKWRKDQWKRLEEESRRHSAKRAQNVAYFTSALQPFAKEGRNAYLRGQP